MKLILGFRRPLKALVAAFLLLAGPFTGLARGQQLEASIFGQIKDESGAILPGVTISLKSPALQVPELTTVTDERGEYRFSPLSVGTYEITFSLDGFQTLRREGIVLTLGFQARVDIGLKVGSLQESVLVTGASPVVDVASSASTTKLNQEGMEILPTGRSGINDLLALAPGTRGEYGTGGSNMDTNPNFRAFGQTNEYWSTLDGVVTTPPASGQGNFYDYSAMDESVIQTVGNDAEMPRKGIYLASVIKSGGNEFHGEVFASQTNGNFQSSNIDATLAAQGFSANKLVSRYDRSFQAGGRIVKDQLWWFGEVRDRSEQTDVPNAFAKVQPSFDPPAGAPSRLSGPLFVNNSTAFQNLLQPQGVGKVSYQMSPANKIVGFVQMLEKHRINAPTLYQSPLSPADEHTLMHIGKVEWQHVHGNSFVVDVNSGVWGLSVVYPGRTSEPTSNDIATQASWGDPSSHGNLPYNNRYTTQATVAWYRPDAFLGNHDLKAGVLWTYTAIGRIWESRSANNGTTANLTSGNYTLTYNNGVPFQIGFLNNPVNPQNLDHYFGTFLRDSWTIHRRLTLNVGVRFSHDNGFAPAQCRQAGDWPFTAATCWPEVDLKTFNSFAPRINASYDLTGDGKTIVKGGWDRFDHMRDITPEVDQLNQNVFTTYTFRWHAPVGSNLYVPGTVNLDPNGPDFVSISGTSAEIVNPNEKQPKEDEYSVSIERELIKNMGVRLTGVYTRLHNGYMTVGVERPYSAYSIPITVAIPGPDGKVGPGTDAPGTTLTWYDYPAALGGLANSQTMTQNLPSSLDPSYKSFEIAIAKRLADHWQVNASYSETWSNVPFGTGGPTAIAGASSSGSGLTAYLNGIYPNTPNAGINSSNFTSEYVARGSGAYSFPLDITASAIYERRSGLAQAPQALFTGGQQTPSIVLNIAPIGSIHLPTLNTLDLRVAKTFSVGNGKKIEGRINMFNALNINSALTQNVRVGATYLQPTTIVLPRVLDFNILYKF